MRIIMLSWEYPPNIIGGIARHVHDLSHALAGPQTQVHVITAMVKNLPTEETEGDYLTVHRVAMDTVRPYDLQIGIAQLNFAMAAKAVEIARSSRVDLVHAHDWLTAFAATTLKYGVRAPVVATLHATEAGRNHGIHTEQQRYIHNVEWFLGYEAWRVIVCSEYMRDEASRVLALPADKLRVVYNGIDAGRFQNVRVPRGFRASLAEPGERIVFFVGRMVHEKGLHVLVDAVPKVLRYMPNTKFVIAGGGYSDHHRRRVAELGLRDRFYFLGFVSDEVLLRLYKVADVAVFPSLYEPFGIVALEAMAARAPVVVSDVGGFSSIVQHNVNGVKHYPNSPESLGWAILHVLMAPSNSRKLAQQAFKDVMNKYEWSSLARQTREVYNQVLKQASASGWAAARPPTRTPSKTKPRPAEPAHGGRTP